MTDLVKAIDYEAVVRGAWETVDDDGYIVKIWGRSDFSSFRFCGIFSRWQLAYEFTLQRQDEIRQVDAEIATLEGYLPLKSITDADSAIIHAFEDVLPIRTITEDQVRLSRTIDRLQSIRAELQRGMSAPRDVQEGRDD